MGTGAFVNKPNNKKNLSLSGDLTLLLTVIVLCVFGLIMVFSASYDYSQAVYEGDFLFMFNRQLLWMGIGIVSAFILSRFDYRYFFRLALPMMLVTIGLLVAVLAVKDTTLGSIRSFVDGSIRPSELAKLVTVIYLAVWLYAKKDRLHDVTFGLLPLAIILGVVGGFIVMQPDLSAAGTVLILGGLLFFLAGGDIKQITLLLLFTITVSWLVIQFSETGQARLAEFWQGISNPEMASYHVRRSFEAIIRGGFFGAGLGKGVTKTIGLPVPPTDSIFAVIAEELGLLGSLLVIGLFGVLLWRGLEIAKKAPDMLGTLLASGLSFWIVIEATINIGVMVGLLPFAGNSLPFFSSGGSSLLVMLVAIGILMNIARQSDDNQSSMDEERRTYRATTDLRRGNRRRGLPGTGRV